jgi:Zn finger protein HypA/HybF involved in hydrogenase expression
MQVGGFSSFRSTRRRPLCGLVILASLLGVAGCNQLLLKSSPATETIDGGGEAGIATALTRDSHARYFPIGDSTLHAAQVCSDCHQSATSFADFTCVSCHDHSEDVAAGRHVFITGYVFLSSACFTCHPTGWEAAITPDEHSLKYFPITDAAHGSLACADCHQDPTTSKPFTCTTCHDHSSNAEAVNHTGVAGYTYDSTSCFNCHNVPNG